MNNLEIKTVSNSSKAIKYLISYKNCNRHRKSDVGVYTIQYLDCNMKIRGSFDKFPDFFSYGHFYW